MSGDLAAAKVCFVLAHLLASSGFFVSFLSIVCIFQ
jgi:hypothetical protein